MAMKRDPLKVKLNNQEKGYYSNMWNLANPKSAKTISGQEAVEFMKKSGLTVDKLKEIWRISAQTDLSCLTRDEFYIALHLIALQQNGSRCDEEAIRQGLEAPLPKFEDDFKLPGSSNPEKMQASNAG